MNNFWANFGGTRILQEIVVTILGNFQEHFIIYLKNYENYRKF